MSDWIKHVKKVAKDQNLKYGDALKVASKTFKKGSASKTHKGDKDFTTKKGNKDFHESGKDVKKSRKPFTKEQEKMLKEHSAHHSKKHMDEMKKDMKAGISFAMAHKRAMKKVGK